MNNERRHFSKKNFETMDDDIDDLLRYENPEFMSSDFFDSVLSLENNIDQDFLPNLEDDIRILSDSNSQIDEVLSPQSFYSESDKNSSYTQNSDDLILNTHVYEPNQALVAPHKTETKLFIQNPNNKKIIAKSILDPEQFNCSVQKKKTQILRVQSIDNNGEPILLPLNIKNFKILNTSRNITLPGKLNSQKHNANASLCIKEISSCFSKQYAPLALTQEEKRLLAKEGIKLPSHHPLTKNEERELKRIRRKIRNKISAQDSRKRKKEYVDGLEEKVKRGTEENKNLLQKIRALQRQNRTLIAHVNKLQNLIKKSTSSKATTSTCLMVVLLSALLVSLPNMNMSGNKVNDSNDEQLAIRRSLLSSTQMTNEDNTLNMEEFLIFKDEEKAKFCDDLIDMENVNETEFSKLMQELEKEHENILLNNNSKIGIFGKLLETFKSYLQRAKPEFQGKMVHGGYMSNNGFIEPEVDDYLPIVEPSEKKIKFTFDSTSLTSRDVIFSPMSSSHFNNIEYKHK